MQNPYEVLGIDSDATDEDVKKAYRRKAREHHSDKGGSDKMMVPINAAYAILKNPEKRKRYDETGDDGTSDKNPKTETEEMLAKIFREILDADQVPLNIVDAAIDKVNAAIGKIQDANDINRVNLDKRKKRLGRVRSKDKDFNLIDNILNSQIRDIQKAIAVNLETIAKLVKVLDMLELYEDTGPDGMDYYNH